MNYKFIKRVISMVLVTAVSVCTFASDVSAMPAGNVRTSNAVEDVSSDEPSGDYVEVKLNHDGVEDVANNDFQANVQEDAEKETFYTGALEAMNEKVQTAKKATLEMRTAERAWMANGNRDPQGDDWKIVTLDHDINDGYEFKNNTVYYIKNSITITNEKAPGKDAVTVAENARVLIHIAKYKSLTVTNKSEDPMMAAINLPISSSLTVYGDDEENGGGFAVVGGIIDKQLFTEKKADGQENFSYCGKIYILDFVNFSASGYYRESEHAGYVIANYMATVEHCKNVQPAACSLTDKGGVKAILGELVNNLDEFKPQNNHVYFINQDMDFTAKDGENGISISENSLVFLEIAQKIKVNIKGGNATDSVGAGAGINVPESSRLVLMGKGTLNVTGGNGTDHNVYGPAAGIGGRGGSKDVKGENCGEVYILENLTVNAEAGTPGVDDVKGGDGVPCDYGIGGGAGTVFPTEDNPKWPNGKNGEVFIDFGAKLNKGREYFYHYVDISVDVNKVTDKESKERINYNLLYEPIIKGNNDLIFKHGFTIDDLDAKALYIAEREVESREAYRYEVDEYDDDLVDVNDCCFGTYRAANNVWYKHIKDTSGGYLYIFSVILGEYILNRLSDKITNSDPHLLVKIATEDAWKAGPIDLWWGNGTAHSLIFWIHYAQPFGECGEGFRLYKPYTIQYGNSGPYSNPDAALAPIGYSYATVTDAKTGRCSTVMYDTYRFVDDTDYRGNFYVYGIVEGTFNCIDGYNGVNGKNWMNYIPDNASIEQLNMPGTHDTGTFNIHTNPDLIDYAYQIIPVLINEYVPWYAYYIFWLAQPLVFLLGLLPLEILIETLVLDAIVNLDIIMDEAVTAIAQCQDYTIKQQLELGIRVLDVRIANAKNNKDKPTAAERLKVVHGTLQQDIGGFLSGIEMPEEDLTLADCQTTKGDLLTLNDVIKDCNEFLSGDASKNESIVIMLQIEGSLDEKKEDSDLNKNIKEFYDFVNNNEDNIYQIKAGDTMPTIGEAKGKIYIINSDDNKSYDKVPAPSSWDVPAADKIKYLTQIFEEAMSIPQVYGEAKTLSKDDYSPKVYFSSTYDVGWEWEAFFKGFSIENGLQGTPRKLAETVNEFLNTYLFTRGQFYGWILYNFPSEATAAKFYVTNVFDTGKLSRMSLENQNNDVLHIYGLRDKEYTGKPITQKLRIFNHINQLKEGVDYTLTYTDNTNAGTANIKITCKGNYSGEANVTFNILPKDMSELEVNHIDCENIPNPGKTVKIFSNVKDGKKALRGDGIDYSVTYLNKTDGKEVSLTDIPAGTYKMVVTGCNNYTGKYEAEFEMLPKDMIAMSKAKITLTKKGMSYGEKDVPKVKSIKIGGKTYTDNGPNKIADVFDIMYPVNGNEIGTYQIVVKAKAGNAAKIGGSKRVKYNVNKLKLNKSMFKVTGSYVYNGLPIDPTFETALNSGKDFEVSAVNNNKAGKAYAVFSGIGNYTGSVKVPFTIKKYDIKNVSISVNGVSEFNKAGAKADITATAENMMLLPGRDYTISYKDNKKLGTATATLKGKGNFEGSNSVSFEIGKASISSNTISVNIKDVVYANNKSTYKPTVTVKQSKKALKNNTDYTVTYENDGTVTEQDMAKGYKEIKVTIKAADNSCYTGERTETFTVFLKGREASKLTGTVIDQHYRSGSVTISANAINLKDKDGNAIPAQDISIISYKNNKKVGNSASVSFKVKGFGGIKTLKFKILPKTVK